MSDSTTTNASKCVAALQEHARRVQEWKAEKLNPKADQLLVDMGIKKDDTAPTCTITQEKIDYKDCVKTSCGHYFSCEEFWEWTKQSNKCPNCREELIQRDRSEELALKNLLDRRREIREQVRDAYEEYDNVNEKIIQRNRVLKAKNEELQELKQEEKEALEVNEIIENSIQCNEEILEEIRLYKTNRSQWEKRMKRRERLEIHRGKDRWRTDMKIVHKELFQKNFSWLEDELVVREEYTPRIDDEVDISETNMFELPLEFAGHENRKTMCMWTEYDGPNEGNHRPVLEAGEVDEINWDSYDYIDWADRVESGSDMSIDTDYDDMPELIDGPGTPPNQMIPRWPEIEPILNINRSINGSINPNQIIRAASINNNRRRGLLVNLFNTIERNSD